MVKIALRIAVGAATVVLLAFVFSVMTRLSWQLDAAIAAAAAVAFAYYFERDDDPPHS